MDFPQATHQMRHVESSHVTCEKFVDIVCSAAAFVDTHEYEGFLFYCLAEISQNGHWQNRWYQLL